MIDVEILVDKLNSFESADDVAFFLYDQNIRGEVGSAARCVISQWIMRESGYERVSTASEITIWNEDEFCPRSYPINESVAYFINRFDSKVYPQLIMRPED